MRRLLSAGLLLTALSCTSHPGSESAQPVASCRLDQRDRQVLQAVLEQVVLGSGACAESGLVLIYELTVSPEFPATREQALRQQEIDRRLAAGEVIDDEELLDPTPRSAVTDLELSNGLTIDRATVQSTLERQACGIGVLAAPRGWGLSKLEVGVHDDLFGRDIPQGWKRLRKRFSEMECLVKFSAPGYVGDADQAIVSFSRMSGPLGGMGGFVVLRGGSEGWMVEWFEALWVS